MWQDGFFTRVCDECGSQYEVSHMLLDVKNDYPDMRCIVCENVVIPGRVGSNNEFKMTISYRSGWELGSDSHPPDLPDVSGQHMTQHSGGVSQH